tara:strand:- start:247 stop:621 length:375 start_codon:yes stop_codon:yes gene_type:complete
VRIFKTKFFAKWAKKEKLKDFTLVKAVHEMDLGLVDADLGSNVYKKRISLNSSGKRGGARSIIAYRRLDKAFFIFGYSKNERSNISDKQKQVLKLLSQDLFSYSAGKIEGLLEAKELIEVQTNE